MDYVSIVCIVLKLLAGVEWKLPQGVQLCSFCALYKLEEHSTLSLQICWSAHSISGACTPLWGKDTSKVSFPQNSLPNSRGKEGSIVSKSIFPDPVLNYTLNYFRRPLLKAETQ